MAENLGTMACKYRLEPHGGTDRVDRHCPFEERPGADRIGQQAHAVGLVIGSEVTRPVPGGRLGVGLDDDRRAGVILLRVVEHFAKGICIRLAVGHAGIALCLVDHQHIARIGAGGGGIEGGVFAQMGLLQILDCPARAVHQGGVVQRMRCQKVFEIGRLAAIEMHPALVDQKPDGRLSVATGMERAQERIFDPDQPRTGGLCRSLPSLGIRRMAPDRDQVVGPRLARVAGDSQPVP